MPQLSPKIIEALNDQINFEFHSAYAYLALVSYFEGENLDGFAHWMRLQYEEELSHAMRLFDFVISHGSNVEIRTIEGPRNEFSSPIDAFTFTLEHERKVTKRIYNLYEIAMKEHDYTVKVEMEWFISEQLEEENNASGILDKLRMIEGNAAALFALDRDLAGRVNDAE